MTDASAGCSVSSQLRLEAGAQLERRKTRSVGPVALGVVTWSRRGQCSVWTPAKLGRTGRCAAWPQAQSALPDPGDSMGPDNPFVFGASRL